MRAHHLKAISVFLLACAVSVAMQGLLWSHTLGVIDYKSIWQPVLYEFAAGQLPSLSEQVPVDGGPVASHLYPAIPILLGGGWLVAHGMDPDEALRHVIVILSSLGIACSVLTAYLLRPRTLWWLGALIMLAFSTTFVNATPATSAVISFIPLLFLLALWCYERPESWYRYVILGLAGGCALSLRFDLSCASLALILVFLLSREWRKALVAGGAALVTFLLIDPYMRSIPIEHVTTMLNVAHHYYLNTPSARPSLVFILSGLLLPLFTCAFGLLLAWRMPDTLRMPQRFALFLFGSLLLLGAVVLSARYYTTWYVYPLAITAEVFLPLVLFGLMAGSGGLLARIPFSVRTVSVLILLSLVQIARLAAGI